MPKCCFDLIVQQSVEQPTVMGIFVGIGGYAKYGTISAVGGYSNQRRSLQADGKKCGPSTIKCQTT